MQNGSSSATGTQELPSSPQHSEHKAADMSIERALQGLGVGWMRSVHTYHVGEMQRTLKDAMTTAYAGLKVIIADGECQLERQRRVRPATAKKLAAGERVVRVKYGVDEDTCTGDHSCIRLSGCPTLTVKDNPDPLRKDPVATVIDGCVGCGLCGENAHAATLCPSFYRAEVVQNPGFLDRLLASLRGLVVPA
jgi:indolepyruvate ferredoxin oxidoreductase alpha subunit